MKRLIILPLLAITICFSSCELIALGWYMTNESHKKRDELWNKDDYDYHVHYIRYSSLQNPRKKEYKDYYENGMGLSPMIPCDTIINYYDIDYLFDYLYTYYPDEWGYYHVSIGNKKELPITISDKSLIEKYIDNDDYDSVFVYWSFSTYDWTTSQQDY